IRTIGHSRNKTIRFAPFRSFASNASQITPNAIRTNAKIDGVLTRPCVWVGTRSSFLRGVVVVMELAFPSYLTYIHYPVRRFQGKVTEYSPSSYYILADLRADTSTSARFDRPPPSPGIRCRWRSGSDNRREFRRPVPECTSTRSADPQSARFAAPEA